MIQLLKEKAVSLLTPYKDTGLTQEDLNEMTEIVNDIINGAREEGFLILCPRGAAIREVEILRDPFDYDHIRLQFTTYN